MLNDNLIRLYAASFRANFDLPALTDYFKEETFTYGGAAAEIARLHLLFRELGIVPGDRIALIGRNNPRWCITYLATIAYGAVIVPILQDFHPNDVHHIINHSESRLLFLGDNFWDVIEEERIPQVEAVFSLTDFHVVFERTGDRAVRFVQELPERFRAAYPCGFGPEDIAYPEVENGRMVLLNYTSGTTGHSKGVMLTVNNLTGNVLFARDAVNTRTGTRYFQRGGRTLSFLPLAHAYGCAFDF
ncbi:AMP-binding protein, partial [uncultured Alistipes sp.]